MSPAKDNNSTYTYGSGQLYNISITGYNLQQQQELKDRNYDGFYDSPEYLQFVKLLPEFAYAMDREPYESDYFGTMTQGKFYGTNIDYAFKIFQRRIKGLPLYENIYGNPETQTGVTEIQTRDTAVQTSGVPWLLLAAAAAYFLT